MASMAALLLMIAWHMSEYEHFIRIIKVAPTTDRLTLLTCFSLTVLIDMEVAVAVGMSLAAVLFIKRSIELSGTRLSDPDDSEHPRTKELPAEVVIYDIDGPLFFGSAQKALSTLTEIQQIKIVILNMSDVTMLDMTAMVAMESVFENFKHRNILLIINGLNARMLVKLRKVGISNETGLFQYTSTLDEAITLSKKELNLR
jgi:SulP family sulfate permease